MKYREQKISTSWVGLYLISTEEALEPADEEDDDIKREFRRLKPDDGTTAAWVFDYNEVNTVKWNLIMTDCVRDFLTQTKFATKI